MQLKPLLVAALAAVAAADSIGDLVKQIPQCAKGCLDAASKEAGCDATDTACVCAHGTEVTKNAIGCLNSGCSQEDLSETTKLSTQICMAEAKGASGSAAASAMASATASMSAGATDASSKPSVTPGAGAHVKAGMGLVGAAALAAIAL
ncbi:hypothetical protein F4780DRAFT_796862 [Xylariomycetidae sp. FL0641]|nr:hypothetical protein F4780DRAFT_796862 [Xylariomycetidae sp. FL0641]